MNFSSKIALRYIISRKSFNFITIINIIALIGITVGVAAIIIIMSVLNGFNDLAKRQITIIEPHLKISSEVGNTLVATGSLIDKIESIDNFSYSFPQIDGKIILLNKNKIQAAELRTFPNEESKFKEDLRAGLFHGEVSNENYELPSIVIGVGLADKLNSFTGDTLTLLPPYLIESSIRTMGIRGGFKAIISGILQTSSHKFDHFLIMTNDSFARKVLRIPSNKSSSIHVKLNDFDDSENGKQDAISKLKKKYKVEGWFDLNKELFNILKFEKLSTFIIMSLIILIAVFNILASLSMTVYEKRPDIAVMKSLGATNDGIKQIFLKEGLFIGMISSISGTMLGLGFIILQEKFNWFAFDKSKYIIDSLPILLNWADVIYVNILSLTLTFLATLYPSKKASKVIISRAINFE